MADKEKKEPSKAEQQKRWDERFTWKPGDIEIEKAPQPKADEQKANR